jgi:septum formation protein
MNQCFLKSFDFHIAGVIIMKIILASGSPRRYDLLNQMEWDLEVRTLPFAEVETVNEATEQLHSLRNIYLANTVTQSNVTFSEKDLVLLSPYRNADLVCAYNALGKGKAAAKVTGTYVPVIAADTIVVLEDKILGKPADASDAKRMLRELSGKAHEVKTAAAVLYQDKTVLTVITTKVFFRELTENEINWYVRTGEPLDKAGAYGIQGKGAVLVEKIEGSYDNVVGLPLTAVYEILKNQLSCTL